jgi:hypothetical protein
MSEYNKEIGIDKHALDDEWLKQPSLYIKYVELSAEANRIRDLKREAIDVIKAECSMIIRDNPEKFGLTKVTEAAIQNVLLQDDQVNKTLMNYHVCKKEAEILAGVVRAFEQRKKALENLVQLQISGYFASPSTKKIGKENRPDKKIITEQTKEQQEIANKKFKRRK